MACSVCGMATNETRTTLDHAALIYRHAKLRRDAVKEARRLLDEARALRRVTDLDTPGLVAVYRATLRAARRWRAEAYAAMIALSHFTRQAVQEDAQSGYVARVRAEAAVDHGVLLSAVSVYGVSPGYGRHTHDASCPRGCWLHCDDSDLIIEVTYNARGHRAVYGVLDGAVSLWMN